MNGCKIMICGAFQKCYSDSSSRIRGSFRSPGSNDIHQPSVNVNPNTILQKDCYENPANSAVDARSRGHNSNPNSTENVFVSHKALPGQSENHIPHQLFDVASTIAMQISPVDLQALFNACLELCLEVISLHCRNL